MTIPKDSQNRQQALSVTWGDSSPKGRAKGGQGRPPLQANSDRTSVGAGFYPARSVYDDISVKRQEGYPKGTRSASLHSARSSPTNVYHTCCVHCAGHRGRRPLRSSTGPLLIHAAYGGMIKIVPPWRHTSIFHSSLFSLLFLVFPAGMCYAGDGSAALPRRNL